MSPSSNVDFCQGHGIGFSWFSQVRLMVSLGSNYMDKADIQAYLVHIVHLVCQVHLVATKVDLRGGQRGILHLMGVWHQGGTEHLVSAKATTARRLQRCFWVQSVQRCHVFFFQEERVWKWICREKKLIFAAR